MKIIEGNLITLAKQGHFDVIAHGCNCFNMQGAGFALQMAKEFDTANPDKYKLEGPSYLGDYNKLGCIEGNIVMGYSSDLRKGQYHNENFEVVNMYTQYYGGKNLSYLALHMCMNKLNHRYGNLKVGLPLIGCGIAGGDWKIVKEVIDIELTNMDVTIVEYK